MTSIRRPRYRYQLPIWFRRFRGEDGYYVVTIFRPLRVSIYPVERFCYSAFLTEDDDD